MRYITCIHALNLPCALEPCGDWHQSALQWERPQTRESEGSFFGDNGIEADHRIPEHQGETFYVANTIRACPDLLYEGNFAVAQGMNEDFICNDIYDDEVFSLVYSMREHENWENISEFMKREYRMKWLNYLKQKGDVW